VVQNAIQRPKCRLFTQDEDLCTYLLNLQMRLVVLSSRFVITNVPDPKSTIVPYCSSTAMPDSHADVVEALCGVPRSPAGVKHPSSENQGSG
jgi:hypothetical protein